MINRTGICKSVPSLLFLIASGFLFCSHTLAQKKSDSISLPTYQLTFDHDGVLKELTVEAVVEAQDGGVLARSADGHLQLVQPENIKKKEELSTPLTPMTQDELCRELEGEFEGFKTLKTKNYVICYETSDAYAQWVGSLYEKLYKGFQTYWKGKDFKLQEPRFPLAAIVFKSQASYLRYSEPRLGKAASSMLGYYEILENRVVMFDLTNIEGTIPPGKKVNKLELINQVLAQPTAERNVSTIRHEAVHQIAYNTGLQVRLADNPMWVSEGLAIFFESHDTSSKSGKGVGLINEHNLRIFQNYLPRRDEDSLLKLLTEDNRFRESSTISISYGESWAFNYFLLKRHTKEYIAYLKFLSSKKPQQDADAKQRIEEFQKFFKDDLQVLNRDFLQFMATLN